MMTRTLFGFFAALLAACACGTAAAQSSILIGDFEGANGTNTDGWLGQNSALISNFNNFPSAAQKTATRGTAALVVTPPTAGFTWAIRLDNNARPTLGADILSHPLLKADVTWVKSQWQPDATPNDPNDNWAKWDIVAVNDNTGWQQMPASADTGNPAFPGSWDSTNFPDFHQRTVTWDLRGQVIDTAGFVQLWMSVNMNNTSNTTGKPFWIDNIRLEAVPEPASLSLVAMAGIGLLGLRRRLA